MKRTSSGLSIEVKHNARILSFSEASEAVQEEKDKNPDIMLFIVRVHQNKSSKMTREMLGRSMR